MVIFASHIVREHQTHSYFVAKETEAWKRTGWNDNRWDLRPTPELLDHQIHRMLELVTEGVPRVAFSWKKMLWVNRLFQVTTIHLPECNRVNSFLPRSSPVLSSVLSRGQVWSSSTTSSPEGSTERPPDLYPKATRNQGSQPGSKVRNSFSDSHVRWIGPLVIKLGTPNAKNRKSPSGLCKSEAWCIYKGIKCK